MKGVATRSSIVTTWSQDMTAFNTVETEITNASPELSDTFPNHDDVVRSSCHDFDGLATSSFGFDDHFERRYCYASSLVVAAVV